MGSVGVEDGGAGVEAFLQRCAPSGDAAYAELRAVLERLHDPATRRDARVFLAALRRRQQQQSDKDDFFRRFGFRIQELLLHDSPAATAASAFLSVQSADAEAGLDGLATSTGALLGVHFFMMACFFLDVEASYDAISS